MLSLRVEKAINVATLARILCATAILTLTTGTGTAEENWPQFRGTGSMGVAQDGQGLPTHWSETENVVWKSTIPGRGWSSPVVWGEKIFLTTATKKLKEGEDLEKIKPGLYLGGNRDTPKEPHRWVVYCIDWKTGDIVWEQVAHEGIPQHGHHLKNTLASETPVTDGKHVYAYFGNIGLFCYDLDGNLVWKKQWESYPTRYNWGTAASPLLHEDRIYVVNDNDEKSFMVALNKETGEEIWNVDRDEESNWATPYIWKNVDRTEIVTPGTNKIRSYDLEGNVLWELGGMSSITIPTPFSKFGMLYVTSGYIMDQTRPIFAIQPGAEGDITLQKGETTNGYIAWSQPKGGPYNTTPTVVGNVMYVLYDRGILGAYDAKTGEEIFRKRIGDGARNFTASPWAYDGKLFCLSEAGDTHVFEASRKFNKLHINSLNEFSMSTPAIVRKSLIIRTESQLYRIEQGATKSGD